MAKIAYLVTEGGYFLSHRLPVARAALRAGYEVIVLSRASNEDRLQIESYGFRLVPLRHMSRSQLGLLSQIKSLFEIIRIYRKERPNIVHHVAMKPVLLGSLAAVCTQIPKTINALAGLGFLFISKNPFVVLIRFFVLSLFFVLFRLKNNVLIIQNKDDYQFFGKFVPRKNLALIRGSGVDVHHFYPKKNAPPLPVTFILGARMLWDKGIGEAIDACRLLQQEGLQFSLILAGKLDPENPKAIDEKTLVAWEKEGLCTWAGHQIDMRSLLKKAHVGLLPSYREGLPKFLLDAGACGMPLITTDVPGCREVVIHHKTGLLVPKGDAVALAGAMKILITSKPLREKLGRAARKAVETNFSNEKVICETLKLYAPSK